MQIQVDGMKEYIIGEKIGEGTFSIVYSVQKKNSKNGEKYAMKIIKDKYKSLEEVRKNEEIRVMAKIGPNPNIICLKDIIFEPKKSQLALVMDLMDMNLLDLLSPRSPPLSVDDCLKLTYQLLKALSYIHQLGFIHRDVKPENCLINRKTMELKLADFGSTRTPAVNTNMTEYVATRWYRPPECLLTSGDYGMAIDIWAVGCVLYEMITKMPLFPGKNAIDQIQKINQIVGTPDKSQLTRLRVSDKTMMNIEFCDAGQFEPTAQIELKKLLPEVSDEIIDLLCKMLAYVPDDRISSKDALNHPAFDSIRYEMDVQREMAEIQKNIGHSEKLNEVSQKVRKSKKMVHWIELNENKLQEQVLIPASSESAPVMSPAHGKRLNFNKPIHINRSKLPIQRSNYQDKRHFAQGAQKQQILQNVPGQMKTRNPKIYIPKNHMFLTAKPQSRINQRKEIGIGLYQKNVNVRAKPQSVLCQPGSKLPAFHPKKL